jgi:CubicO group peptidase (beta-lactamase class C family)
MKSPAFFRTVLGCSLALLPCGIAADPGEAEKAAGRLRELTKGDSAGVAVLLARDGTIVFQGGFGFANLEQKLAITPETKFRIGSMTKQFTAAAILRLAEQKKLAVTDRLAKFYPEFPRSNEITLRHLLTHTSGIHSYTEKPEFLSRVATPIEPAKLVESFKGDPPDFAPGAGFHYSNAGYFLVGEIVGKAAGKLLGDYLREQFFDPLGMKDTGLYVNSAPPPVADRSADTKTFAARAGRYDYKDAIMTVTGEGDRIFAQLTGQPRFPIFPKSATEFEWRVAPAKVQFVRGGDGKLYKAVHTQNGTTFDAPRIK